VIALWPVFLHAVEEGEDAIAISVTMGNGTGSMLWTGRRGVRV
jgi:hypothetical protein